MRLIKTKKMKTLFSIVVLFLTMNIASAQNSATVKSASDLTSLKDKGKGFITLPGNLTKEDVASKSKYYTLYFTVEFDDKTKVATINMVDNTERSRAIITRFLAACEVQTIVVGNETVHRDQLFEKYLK